jgi:beta-galactosidase
VWDEDFARIRAGGLQVVRSFTFWNWMEPEPGVIQLDDIDLFFDTAARHDLYVWLDLPLATHGSCPEWLLREHPDIRVVDHCDRPAARRGSAAVPQGGMIHCYDHPLWRELAGRLLRHVVARYRERPNLLIWGLWDGICPAHLSARVEMSCYCENTLRRYHRWLQDEFTLDELNRHVQRRYPSWDAVEAPRSDHMVVEMLLLRRFHRENLADHLAWMVAETRALDPHHEVRAHGAGTPRPWDEICARGVDSWGMSMSSNNLLTGGDEGALIDRAFICDLSRCLGAEGRWWNEEIYAGMARGGVTWKKQSDPRELTTLLWISLANGAAGTMFWQYRPEYLSFESPGYNLVALDGEPTLRWHAVVEAAARVRTLKDHLPLQCPQAEVAIVFHPESQELFGLNDETQRFNADLRGVYRTLWRLGVPVDLCTPNQNWSGYRLLFLPNAALMTPELRARIERTLDEQPETRIVAEGSFGLYSADGQSSYSPPEGLAERLGVRVADFDAVTQADIAAGRNLLRTAHGEHGLSTPCGYAVLEGLGETEEVAHLADRCVGVRTADGRFTWLGLSLSAGFGDTGQIDIVKGLVEDAGIRRPVRVEGDRLVPVVRQSRQGGSLLFLFNLESRPSRACVYLSWICQEARDMTADRDLAVTDGALDLDVGPWETAVIHCAGAP